MSDPPGVLYIGGWGRSGSTLLALLLGQVPGLVAVGEVRELWRRGLAEDGACGCGERFRACPVWSEVGERAFGGWDRLDLEAVLRARYSIDRGWTIPLLSVPGAPLPGRALLPGYLRVLERLYRACAEVSGARWVVDSSKLASHAMVLRRIPSLDVRVLHLVRDSRGVASSWRGRVDAGTGTDRRRALPRYGAIASSLRYDAYNTAASHLRRSMPYLRLRYEDVARQPATALAHVLDLVGEARDGVLGFVEGDQAVVHPTHTADGNPMRFASGTLRIEADEAWRRGMPAATRRVVTGLTWPWLAAYGYRQVGR